MHLSSMRKKMCRTKYRLHEFLNQDQRLYRQHITENLQIEEAGNIPWE
jgi:hypothetical protein